MQVFSDSIRCKPVGLVALLHGFIRACRPPLAQGVSFMCPGKPVLTARTCPLGSEEVLKVNLDSTSGPWVPTRRTCLVDAGPCVHQRHISRREGHFGVLAILNLAVNLIFKAF